MSTPPFRRPHPRSIALANAVARVLYAVGAWVLFRHARYTRGVENIPKEGAFLLLANHTSALDPLWAAWAVRRTMGAMASSALFRRPLLRRVLALLGAFPKTKFVKEPESMQLLTELYQGGTPILIYPEGTRTWDGEPVPVLPGIARLIQRLNARVVYCRCTTGFLFMPRWSYLPRWVPVELEYSPVQTYEGQSEARILAAVNAGIRCSSEARGHGLRWGWRLAHGLEEYLFACPDCLAEESLHPDPADGNHLGCRACGRRWRLDLDARLHPQPAGPERTVAQTFAGLAARIRAQGALDAARLAQEGVLLRCPQASVAEVGEGRALRPLAEGTLTLTPEALEVHDPGGALRWRLPLASVLTVSLEAGSALYLRTDAGPLRLFPTGQSRFKWAWFVRERWIAARPELEGQVLPFL